MERIEQFLRKADDELQSFELLASLSHRTGFRIVYLASFFLVLFTFLLFFFGAPFITTLVGIAYPIHASLKTIDAISNGTSLYPSKSSNSSSQTISSPTSSSSQSSANSSNPSISIRIEHSNAITQWLSYWIFFSFFSMLESFGQAIITLFPFYYAIKVFLLLYAQIPAYNGARFLYVQFLKPLHVRHGYYIDNQLERIGNSNHGFLKDLVTHGIPTSMSSTSKSQLNSSNTNTIKGSLKEAATRLGVAPKSTNSKKVIVEPPPGIFSSE